MPFRTCLAELNVPAALKCAKNVYYSVGMFRHLMIANGITTDSGPYQYAGLHRLWGILALGIYIFCKQQRPRILQSSPLPLSDCPAFVSRLTLLRSPRISKTGLN